MDADGLCTAVAPVVPRTCFKKELILTGNAFLLTTARPLRFINCLIFPDFSDLILTSPALLVRMCGEPRRSFSLLTVFYESGMPIRLLVADDHELVRRGLRLVDLDLQELELFDRRLELQILGEVLNAVIKSNVRYRV